MRQSSLQKNSGRLPRPFANKRDYESSMLGGKGSRSDGLGFRSRWHGPSLRGSASDRGNLPV